MVFRYNKTTRTKTWHNGVKDTTKKLRDDVRKHRRQKMEQEMKQMKTQKIFPETFTATLTIAAR